MKKLIAVLLCAVLCAAAVISVGADETEISKEKKTELMCQQAEDYLSDEWGGYYKYEATSLLVMLSKEDYESKDLGTLLCGAEYYGVYDIKLPEADNGYVIVRVSLYEKPTAVDRWDADACVARMKRAIREFMAIDEVPYVMPYPYIDWCAEPSTITLSTGEEVEDGEVIVVIKHESSGLAKEWSLDDFPGVGAYGIEYISSLRSGAPEDYPMLNYDNFCQMLLLSVASGEDALKGAIAALKSLDFVADAFPNYIVYLDEYELEDDEPPKATVRFYCDADKTDEIADLAGIAAGDRVWFSLTPAEGYACVSFKVNFAELTMEELCVGDSFTNGVIASIPGSEFEYTVQTALKGDINGDGALNAKDVTTFMKALVDPSWETYWRYLGYNPVADVNNDGRYNAKDVTRLMKHLVDPTVKICEKTFCDFDCLIKAEPLFFFEGSTVLGISGYGEILDFAEEHGLTVPEYLTPDYYSDHDIHSYWIPVDVDPEDPSTFPRLRYYSTGVARYDTDYAAEPAPEAKHGWALYLVWAR